LKSGLAAVLMFGLLAFATGCHRQPASPGVPVPAAYLKQGEISFEKADFGQAVIAYENYLSQTPNPKEHDRLLFRLALAYAIPGHPSHNPGRSTELLNRLVALYPQSPLKPQAEYILLLQAESENLKTINESARAELEKAKTGVRERDERIKLLREELDKLKKIDLERRPSRPLNK
jgi:outer membrane protein assembly factor BamD (BamD/ComL family)